MSRERNIITSTEYYAGPNARRANASRKKPIKVQKTVTINRPKKTIVKTVDYGPMTTYGTQTKTRTRTVTKK